MTLPLFTHADDRIAALEATVAAQEQRIAALEGELVRANIRLVRRANPTDVERMLDRKIPVLRKSLREIDLDGSQREQGEQ